MKLVTLKHAWLHGQEIYALVTVKNHEYGERLKLWLNCTVAPQTGDNAFATVNRTPTIEYRKDRGEIACLLLYGPSDAVYYPAFNPSDISLHQINYIGNYDDDCINVLRQYCDEELAFEQAEVAAKL